jgi:dolichol-phosphate mannosyltransferase
MRILTVLVTYNEASNIERLIPAIRQHLPGSSVLVVDDSSPDGTADIVRGLQASDPRIELMIRPAKRGYGSAAIAGLQYGIRNGFDAIATLDADFSHDPADLPRLVEALSRADVSIGSRYVGGIRVLNWEVRRLLLSLAANRYVRLLSGLTPVDCTSGFRAYRVDALKKVAFDRISSTGYAFLPELLFAQSKGERIRAEFLRGFGQAQGHFPFHQSRGGRQAPNREGEDHEEQLPLGRPSSERLDTAGRQLRCVLWIRKPCCHRQRLAPSSRALQRKVRHYLPSAKSKRRILLTTAVLNCTTARSGRRRIRKVMAGFSEEF